MSRMILAFAVSISLFTTLAFAQDNPQGQRFIATQPCEPVANMTKIVMEKYGEQPLFSVQGIQFSAVNDKGYTSDMMFFVNQDTGTWSLISLYPDGTGCMVATGREFEPYMGPTY